MSKQSRKSWKQRVARGMRADRVIELGEPTHHGPLGWLELRAELESRLQSSGGRPSDPHWDIKRSIPFSSALWERLSATAKQLSTPGRQVSAGALAAQLIEQGLERLERMKSNAVVRTAEPGLAWQRSSPETGGAAGATSARNAMERERRRLLEDATFAIGRPEAA